MLFAWGVLGVYFLTYCSGESSEEEDSSTGGTRSGTSNGGSSEGGVSTGGVSTGGVSTGGFAGHTGHCIGNPCGPGCGICGGAGQGGVSTGGFSGAPIGGASSGRCIANPCECMPCGGAGQGGAGQGGVVQGGNSGFSGTFAGHTGSCASTPCMFGCPGPCGGAGQGGMSGAGNGGISGQSGAGAGAGGFAGFSGNTGSGFASLPREEKTEPLLLSPSVTRGCYQLAGVENDPCLPADDAVISWLDARPAGCEPHVVGGPVQNYDGRARWCCYSLTCENGAAPSANGLPHGLR